MFINKIALCCGILLLSLGTAFFGRTGAHANIADYESQLVDQQVMLGGGSLVTVQLIHKPSARAIPGAVLVSQHVDMGPDGMARMDAPLEIMSDMQPDYYQFETDLTMEGQWALSLVAKVPGEDGYMHTNLVLMAVR